MTSDELLDGMANAMVDPELTAEIPLSIAGTAVRRKVLQRALDYAASQGWYLLGPPALIPPVLGQYSHDP